MCTLLVYRRPVDGIELVVAANRDEAYVRPHGSFGVIRDDPLVIGGLDPEGGGSWLAVSVAGFVAAVTNARLGARRRPGQRSRGLLVRDLVSSASAAEAFDRLRTANLERYAPVNAIVVDGTVAVVATNCPMPRVASRRRRALGLGNRPAFEDDERVSQLLELGAPRTGDTPKRLIDRLEEVLSRHEPPSACHHLPEGGTVSSTIMVLGRDRRAWRILHADGPPCISRWDEVKLPER